MNSDNTLYVKHDGTIQVSGSTQPAQAASCAIRMLLSGTDRVELVHIGANAGNQSTKAMLKIVEFSKKDLPLDVSIAFVPFKHDILMTDSRRTTCVVWRVVINKLQ